MLRPADILKQGKIRGKEEPQERTFRGNFMEVRRRNTPFLVSFGSPQIISLTPYVFIHWFLRLCLDPDIQQPRPTSLCAANVAKGWAQSGGSRDACQPLNQRLMLVNSAE